MKRLLLAILCAGLFLVFACQGNETPEKRTEKSDSSYAIIGKVTGQDSGIIYISNRQSGKKDSAVLDHGYFKFNGKTDSAEYCVLILNGQSKVFFLENGKISMLIRKDSLPDALISGTKTQDEYNYFLQLGKPVSDRMKKVDKAYDEANKKKNRHVMDSLEKVYDALDLEQKQLVIDYTKSHPSSFVTAFEIYSNFLYNFRPGQLDSLYQQLDSGVRKSYFGRKIQNTIEKTKLTSVGNPAPDFTSTDADGKPVSLSSFKGKYVLLDFWASWCGPCRRENPSVVKAYHTFHPKGFNIFGVSLDDTKSDWLAAIKKDGLDWTQVSELKGWNADVVSLYGIKAIPMNFLIDKNGIIIARELRGEELGSKLADLLH